MEEQNPLYTGRKDPLYTGRKHRQRHERWIPPTSSTTRLTISSKSINMQVKEVDDTKRRNEEKEN